jgi:hypothetical protein
MTSKFTDLPRPAFHVSVVRLACSACGAEANASCNCGKPYLPRERAAKAVAEHPEKSDRAIAEEIGVSHPTVAKARREAATGNDLPVEKSRIGKDGKTRKLPNRIESACDIDWEWHREDDSESDAVMHARAAEWQLHEAERMALEFALLRAGARPTKTVLQRIDQVIKAWRELRIKLQAALDEAAKQRRRT